ncbi:MAG: hypothetical protein OXF56_23145 [Rhodobacteraceae bacterium]|nr:hypothetical protein [Paracoccaceae bacterium]
MTERDLEIVMKCRILTLYADDTEFGRPGNRDVGGCHAAGNNQ